MSDGYSMFVSCAVLQLLHADTPLLQWFETTQRPQHRQAEAAFPELTCDQTITCAAHKLRGNRRRLHSPSVMACLALQALRQCRGEPS